MQPFNAHKQIKHAVGYIRVSTLDQAEEGVSLDTQREKISQYAQLHGMNLLHTYSDEGLSGKRADNRPGLQMALKHACESKGVIVVYSLSRFARSVRDCIDLSEKLRKCGADLASITEKLDTGSAMGEFFFCLMAALGQLERRQIAERTKAAMGHLRKQGMRISGHIPYGKQLSLDRKRLIPCSQEVEWMGWMQRSKELGSSFGAIARELNRKNVPAKNGGKWYASSVRSVLISKEGT